MNRIDSNAYDPELQRHHLIPRQVRTSKGLARFVEILGHDALGLDDFRRNGLLLPCFEEAALLTGLPLHRGPQRAYNDMVMERMSSIERDWAARRASSPGSARLDALMRMELLQRALRRSLLSPVGMRLRLNLRDPVGRDADFSDLDAMADMLWSVTGEFVDIWENWD